MELEVMTVIIHWNAPLAAACKKHFLQNLPPSLLQNMDVYNHSFQKMVGGSFQYSPAFCVILIQATGRTSKLISWGHIHLSHAFIIHAFSLKLLKDLSKSMVFPTPHNPCVYGEEHWTFAYPVYVAGPSWCHPTQHPFLWCQFWNTLAASC